ncbi:hypothetical protein K503DRAFT_20861 [Rhizopogon vinicolor AM-OR11-026]|uniref:Uncharacterized protein n=1 Tax=Rhizopogon vinicolor AM-OR11-026 TaxID=1314800 RepID=A0A1B7MHJ8_9AGAM|nr:hypothetical protein K503DRAFT_20861 [Rhizopogon vinicolor AM-OR11-026]
MPCPHTVCVVVLLTDHLFNSNHQAIKTRNSSKGRANAKRTQKLNILNSKQRKADYLQCKKGRNGLQPTCCLLPFVFPTHLSLPFVVSQFLAAYIIPY